MKRSASGTDEPPPNKRSAPEVSAPAEAAPAEAAPSSTPLSESKCTPKRLLGELKQAQKVGFDPDTQLRIGLIDDANVYKWKCEKKYTDSADNSPQQQRIYEGLQKMGKDTLTYHLVFNDDYPFKPPFVYLHHPHLQNCNVFGGGGLCAQQISQQKNNGWSPALNVKTLMVALTTLPETYTDVNVRPGDYDGNTEQSARKDWVKIEKAHPVWSTNKTRS